jgi:hypothetical protein
MLPDLDYANHFDAASDRIYRQFTRPGVLNALATIFVRDNEAIATTEVPLSTAVLTTVVSGFNFKNPAGADSDETCTDFADTGKPLLLEQDMSVDSFFEAT